MVVISPGTHYTNLRNSKMNTKVWNDITAKLFKLSHVLWNLNWYFTEWQGIDHRGGVTYFSLKVNFAKTDKTIGVSLSEITVRFPAVQNWRPVSL